MTDHLGGLLGARDGDGAEGRPLRMLLYADQSLVLAGAMELLQEHRSAPVQLETITPGRPLSVAPGLRVALVDVTAAGAEQAVRVLRGRAETLVLLVAEPEDAGALAASLITQADGILLRDDLDSDLLDLTLEAGRRGLWVSSRRIGPLLGASPSPPLSPGEAPGAPSGAGAGAGAGGGGVSGRGGVGGVGPDRSLTALALLADGLRDAEIAAELNLSESATRKLIQRAVQAAGARTRSQAIAAAIRAGQLT